MSMTETDFAVHNLLPLRAPDRTIYEDRPRLRRLPNLSLAKLRNRLTSYLSLPEILPAHPEAPEPGAK